MSESETAQFICFWGDLKKHPQCPHGPSLLFGRNVNGIVKKFYSCSACRDKKNCTFYMDFESYKINEKTVKQKKSKNPLLHYNHQKLYILFNALLGKSTSLRVYCHSCEKLISIDEKSKHLNHDTIDSISDFQMLHPTEMLKPLEDSKKEAQFLFSRNTVKMIIQILQDLQAKNILCIGTPRIHEYITENFEYEMSSLLLDIDGRFHNFFGPLSFCWYNLFNHYFFQKDAENVFKEFIKQDKGKNMFLVCDPPFGGRVEAISQTIKTIEDLHRKVNNITDEKDGLKIFFIFPYFMEAIMREKANPTNVLGGLRDLKLLDYKVEYDNHPLFRSKADSQKSGSQIRIFTNVPLKSIKLPESEGYKYCKRCDKYVFKENKHCKLCKACTSKDGRRYKHCKICNRCVKPTWRHCNACGRCALEIHKCGQKPKVGNCFKCNEIGHTEKECENFQLKKLKSNKKRKMRDVSLISKKRLKKHTVSKKIDK